MRKIVVAATALVCAASADATVVFADDFSEAPQGYDSSGAFYTSKWAELGGPGFVAFRQNGETIQGKTISCEGGCYDARAASGGYGQIYTRDFFTYYAGDKFTLTLRYSFDQIGTIGESLKATLIAPVSQGNFDFRDLTFDGQNTGDWNVHSVDAYFDYDGAGTAMRTSTWTWTAGASGQFRLFIGSGEALENIDTSDSTGILLDNISLDITPVGGAVPEPASWALMIGGFGWVGFAARRRKNVARVNYA